MPYLNNHFHIYDHQSEVSFQIIGKSNFVRWLNDHANNDRYSFFFYLYKTKFLSKRFTRGKESI